MAFVVAASVLLIIRPTPNTVENVSFICVACGSAAQRWFCEPIRYFAEEVRWELESGVFMLRRTDVFGNAR